MKKYLHNSDEIFESPQYGWEQMQFLLEENLPQKKTKYTKKLLVRCMIAASLITILLFSSLVIGDVDHFDFFEKNATAISANTTGAGRFKAIRLEMTQPGTRHAIPIPVLYVKNNRDKKTGIQDLVQDEPAGANSTAWLTPSPSVHEKRLPYIGKAAIDQPVSSLPFENTIRNKLNNDIIKKPVNNDAVKSNTTKNIKAKKHGSWNLSAGLAVNGMMGRQQNLRPYPTAELRYNVSDNFFLSLGLGAASPVATASRGIQKRAYVNDTTNNVLFYNSNKQYYRLSYADIPLMAGVKVSKRISLQAGVQASVLLDAKNKTSIESYNFQMSMAGEYHDLSPGNAVVSENHYKVKERKIDYRFVTGLKYTINKASFNIIYQYAPRAPLAGDHISHDKNQLLTLNAQFRIK